MDAMLTLIFCVALIVVFVKLLIVAVKAAWGITKIVCAIVFLPIFLVALVMSGLIIVAIPILAIVGIAALLGGASIA